MPVFFALGTAPHARCLHALIVVHRVGADKPARLRRHPSCTAPAWKMSAVVLLSGCKDGGFDSAVLRCE